MPGVTLHTVERASFFTRLDFRAKLWMMLVGGSIALVWEDPLLGGLLLASVFAASLVAGIPTTYIRALFTLMLPFYIFMLVTQGFWGGPLIIARTGQAELTPLFTLPREWWLIGGAVFSLEGALYALNTICKTLTLALIFPLGVFTTGINTMIVSLVKLRVPYKLAFILSSTLRFFPLLFDEIQAIIDAQRLRGLPLERMSVFRRLLVYARVGVPLILGALVKAQTLEIVLQAKAFSGSSERTYLHESRLGWRDYLVFVAGSLFLAAAAYGYVAYGIGRFGGPA